MNSVLGCRLTRPTRSTRSRRWIAGPGSGPEPFSVSLDASCPWLLFLRTQRIATGALHARFSRSALRAMPSSSPPGSAVGRVETHELADFREPAATSRNSEETASGPAARYAQNSNASDVIRDTASFASTDRASHEESGASEAEAAPASEPSQLYAAVMLCVALAGQLRDLSDAHSHTVARSSSASRPSSSSLRHAV